MKIRTDLKQEAKNALRGNWGIAIVSLIIVVAITFILGQVSNAFAPPAPVGYGRLDAEEYVAGMMARNLALSSTLLSIITTFILAPLQFGQQLFFLEMMKTSNASLELLFTPYKNIFKIFMAQLLISIFTTIGFILLIVPGIIISLMLSQVPFIMVDDPDIGFWEAIQKSAAMTKGYKSELFVLYLSFLGWLILGAIPFGIGLLWVIPYMQATFANFYLNLKEINYQEPIQV